MRRLRQSSTRYQLFCSSPTFVLPSHQLTIQKCPSTLQPQRTQPTLNFLTLFSMHHFLHPFFSACSFLSLPNLFSLPLPLAISLYSFSLLLPFFDPTAYSHFLNFIKSPLFCYNVVFVCSAAEMIFTKCAKALFQIKLLVHFHFFRLTYAL